MVFVCPLINVKPVKLYISETLTDEVKWQIDEMLFTLFDKQTISKQSGAKSD